MNRSKKLVFAFFISTAIMSSKNIVNTVYASSDLPNIQSSAYTAAGNIFAKCGYTGQCTWFTYGRVLEKLGIALPSEFYGNAVDWWYANANDNVYSYGSEPKANSVIVWGGGSVGYGHVGFVEEVDGDTIYFNEGNFSVRGSYDGNIKTISKEAIKNRGNLYLKGYIYVGEGATQTSSDESSSSSADTADTYQPVSDGTYESGTVNISNSSSVLNIRNGAGTSFSVLGYLKKGEAVQIVGTVGDWYKIKLNSSYGYVSSSYISSGTSSTNSAVQQLSSSSSSQSSGSSSSTGSGYVKLSTASSTLNLRSAPQGSIISSLTNGTAVNILDSTGGWYKVSVNGTTGYVCSDYISTSQTASTSSVAVAASTSSDQSSTSSQTGKTGTVSLNNSSSVLNLRNNPWTGRVLTTLQNGVNVTILGTEGRWYKIQWGSTVGYVHSDYVKI